MPLPITWTEGMDTQLREMRAVGNSWRNISSAMGLSRHTVMDRGKELGVPELLPVGRAMVHPIAPRSADPLPSGHPITWGAIALPFYEVV